MAKGLPRSRSRGVPVLSPITKLTIPIRNKTIAVANGSSSPGQGTLRLGGLPAANLLFLGAVAYLQFSTADADITATWEGDFSVGTVPTADTDLADAGEADLIPSTPVGPAVAKLSPVTRAASTDALGGGVIDNTDNSLELNLNLLIDDASQSGAADFTVNGYIVVALIPLGDD